MEFRQLMNVIPRKSYTSFTGDPSVSFSGIAFRRRRMSSDRFLVILDETWPVRERKKFNQNDYTKLQIMEQGIARGFQNFIAPDSLKSEEVLRDFNVLWVPSTYEALFVLAGALRTEMPENSLVGITGSAGKTTTKAMLTHALQAVAPETRLLSPGLGENIYPSILSHLARSGDHDLSILEVAGSCFSRFRGQEFKLSPDVSVVTSISEAHLEYLGSLKGVAKTKANIFESNRDGGSAVINVDAPYSGLLINRAFEEGRKVVTYGSFPSAHVRLEDYDPESRRVKAKVFGDELAYTLSVNGRHMALNSLAAIGSLICLGIDDWLQAIPALEEFQALPGRGDSFDTKIGGKEVRVIDESYNASPGSIRASIASFSEAPTVSGRRIAILGDMTGMGDEMDRVHTDLVAPLAESKTDLFIFYGRHMEEVSHQLAQTKDCFHASSLKEVREILNEVARDGDWMLFKASSKTGLSRLLENIRNENANTPNELYR